MITGSLVFFGVERPVVLVGVPGFGASSLMPVVFYVWVNCFGVVVPAAGLDVCQFGVRRPSGPDGCSA